MSLMDSNEGKGEAPGAPSMGVPTTREDGSVRITYDGAGQKVGFEVIGSAAPAPKTFSSLDEVSAAIQAVRDDKKLEADARAEKLNLLYVEKSRLLKQGT